MVFAYNILEAYDKDGNLIGEFTEFEDAARFYLKHNKEYKILLHNKQTSTYFVVPDDELQVLLTK